MKDKKLKLVSVNHMEYNLIIKRNSYIFKTTDNVKEGDYVYCDTQYGLAIGRVRMVYNTIEELVKDAPEMPRLCDIKECRKKINDIYDGLPF